MASSFVVRALPGYVVIVHDRDGRVVISEMDLAEADKLLCMLTRAMDAVRMHGHA